MNDALREAAAVDPDWAKEEARKRAVLIAVTAGAVIAIAIGIVALVLGVHNETRVTNIEPRVTKIEHTPCAKNATSKECQALRAKVERAANLYVTCLPFLKAGYPCPRPGSRVAQLHHSPVEKNPAAQERPLSSSTPVRHLEQTPAQHRHEDVEGTNHVPSTHPASPTHHKSPPKHKSPMSAPPPQPFPVIF